MPEATEGPTVLRILLGTQLRRLRESRGIIPFGISGHAVPGGFTILRFAEPDLPDVAYVEHLTGALYFDKKSEVDRYLLTMERLSIVAAKPNRAPGILTALIDELSEER